MTWEIISPDLTTNDPEKQKQAESGGLTLDVTNAENHTTIICIAPSPVQEGVIWVGTDDGNLQLTKDGGQNWELVSKELTSGKKGMVPPATWIPHVEASKFNAATAYVVFDDHRRSNWTPYVYLTHDFGMAWKSLVTREIDGFAHVIEEDTVNKNLLFLGTEFGLFVSFNGGANWMKWTQGIPTVPVRDIAVHPRENDLIVGTHGRSIYIIDDISPLREISEELMQKKLHLFAVQEAYQFQQGRMSSYQSPGDTPFMGENKRIGVAITYYLIPSERKEEEGESGAMDERQQQMMQRMRQMRAMGRFRGMGMMGGSSRVRITIEDSEGKTISRMNGTENKGINRVYWNFREQTGQQDQSSRRMFFGFGGGTTALPGEYTVKINYDDEEVSQKFAVKFDPRIDVDMAVLKANYEKGKQAQKLSDAINAASRQIEETRATIKTLQDSARQNRDPKNRDLMKAAQALDKKLEGLAETLNPTPAKQGIGDRSAGLRTQVMMAVRGISGAGYEPITQAAQVSYEKAIPKVEEFLKKLNAVYETDVENFKKMLKEADFSLFKPFTPIKIEE